MKDQVKRRVVVNLAVLIATFLLSLVAGFFSGFVDENGYGFLLLHAGSCIGIVLLVHVAIRFLTVLVVGSPLRRGKTTRLSIKKRFFAAIARYWLFLLSAGGLFMCSAIWETNGVLSKLGLRTLPYELHGLRLPLLFLYNVQVILWLMMLLRNRGKSITDVFETKLCS